MHVHHMHYHAGWTVHLRCGCATFIWSFLSVCVLSRSIVAWTSLGSSVSASSVPNDCRVCAVFFTIRANPSIAWYIQECQCSFTVSNEGWSRGGVSIGHANPVACVCLRCGARSTCRGSTPESPPVPASAVCDRGRNAAPLWSSAWSPEIIPHVTA